jgi:PmbA protein
MELLEIARNAVEKSLKAGASQAEASVFTSDSALTRYTKNIIHQNVASVTHYLNLEVVVGENKLGASSVKSLEERFIDQAVDRAIGIARISTPDPEFRSYVAPKPIKPLPGIHVKRTAEITPEERAEGVKTIIETAMDYNELVGWSAGSYENEEVTFALANSLGVEVETGYTRANVEVDTRAFKDGHEGAGFSRSYSHDIGEFDLERMARSAAEDAVNSINPKTIPTGDYEAIFTPASMSTFTGFIGRLGFSARAYHEGYSFVTDKIGEQVFDEKLTITDMGRSLETYNASPFDGEGTPKGDLRLVGDGVAESLCYDGVLHERLPHAGEPDGLPGRRIRRGDDRGHQEGGLHDTAALREPHQEGQSRDQRPHQGRLLVHRGRRDQAPHQGDEIHRHHTQGARRDRRSRG